MFTKRVYSANDYVLNYVVDYPRNFDTNKKYPVILYLHGMGMVRMGVDYVIQKCPVRRERMPEDMDFIIVAPSCDDYMWFENFNHLVRFIKYIEDKPYVDAKRLSLTGSSMGGYTGWLLLVLHSELFYKAVICCGGSLYWAGGNVKTPVIAVHGDEDGVVLCRESEIMVRSINESGGNAKLIIKKGFGHDVWTDTFTDEEIYRWLHA